MKEFIYFITVLLSVLISVPAVGNKSFRGFEANGNLGEQIEIQGLIQNVVNLNRTLTNPDQDQKYSLNTIIASNCMFTMGGVTFYYAATQQGQTIYKTYSGYIQPNGANREIYIPTFPGEQVRVSLTAACSGILVNGVSQDFSEGDNILTATGDWIILKTGSNKPKISAIMSLASGDPSSDRLVEELTVSQAMSIGSTLAANKITENLYFITGYVSAMSGDGGEYATYGNQKFWLADDSTSTASSSAAGAFYVYQGAATREVFVGCKVRILTHIKNYNGLIESESKSNVKILAFSSKEADPSVSLKMLNLKGSIGYWPTSNNCEWGSVIGGGHYPDYTDVNYIAVPAEGCIFLYWQYQNGGVYSTDNPYLITSENIWVHTSSLVAVFAPKEAYDNHTLPEEMYDYMHQFIKTDPFPFIYYGWKTVEK